MSIKLKTPSNVIIVNSATVSTNYTTPTGSNAMSAGPITVDDCYCERRFNLGGNSKDQLCLQ
jgi:hypothetical protein